MTSTAPEPFTESEAIAALHGKPIPELTQTELDHAYPWVRAWGQLQGYSPDQILSKQKEAMRWSAPAIVVWLVKDAVEWTTLLDIWPEAYETRLWLLDWAWSRDLVLPYEVLRLWLDPHARYNARRT